MLTTFGNTDTDYVAVGGSSFAAPLVAGAAGLVRAQFPQLNAEQVAARLRRTTDNIDALPGNVAYAGRLGSGRLNAFRAVTEVQHSARIVARTYNPAASAYGPGDTLRLAVRVRNLLEPVENLTVTLTSESPYLTVRQGSFGAGPLGTLAERANAETPFRLAVAANAPLNARVVLRFHFQDVATGYEEDQYETLLLNPDYVVLDANNLTLTLTSRGNIGYDGLSSGVGRGVSYRQGPPLLAEGGLLLATSATRASDNVRAEKGTSHADFATLARVTLLPAPPRADAEAVGLLRDALPSEAQPRAVGVRIRQHAYAWAAEPHRDYVVLEYQLTNLTPDTLRPLHLGLFMDWDLPGDAGRNVAAWDASRRLGYIYDPADSALYAGVRHLAGGQATAYALDNRAPAGAEVRLSDGFSAAEKWLTLSSGTTHAASAPTGTDVSQVVGAAVPALAPADSVVVAFAVLASPSLKQLQAAADAAGTRYQQVLGARGYAPLAGVRLYPNPTSGRVRLELPAGPATVWLLSALGQELAVYQISRPSVILDLSPYPAGLYLVRVQQAGGTVTHRLIRQP